MGQEIERKFLVTDEACTEQATRRTRMRQGYLSEGFGSSVRVRIENERALLNVKSSRDGIHRHEFEYEIPLEDAATMLDKVALQPLIEKTRYEIPSGRHVWEVDVFEGDNEGLVVAEIELASADEIFERPPWLGQEVSHDLRYYNVSLREKPYKNWKE
jgi:adenylate cyclase